jgi:hypothetical protein
MGVEKPDLCNIFEFEPMAAIGTAKDLFDDDPRDSCSGCDGCDGWRGNPY